jgi:hypothetical protein
MHRFYLDEALKPVQYQCRINRVQVRGCEIIAKRSGKLREKIIQSSISFIFW